VNKERVAQACGSWSRSHYT